MPPQTPDPLNPNPTPNPTPAPAPTHVPAAPVQPSSASAHIDLGKVILPKKPGSPSVDSAQRVNAGVLFEQERTATLPESKKPATKEAQPQTPKAEQPLVKPLQTYQGDIESLVGEKQVSVVSIAAAEAERRGKEKIAPEPTERGPWVKKTLIIATSVLLLAAASGVGFYLFMRSQPVPLAEQAPAPFMSVDDTKTVVLQPNEKRQDIMNALVAAKKEIALSLGLIARIQIAKPGPLNDGTLAEVSAPEFLQALAPSIPLPLVRTLEPQMLVGIHSFDENQAFMILQADSYETAYSGMLEWEESLYGDLSPLFKRTPPVHAVEVKTPAPAPIIAPVGTSTATTSTTSAATSTPPVVVPPPSQPQFLQGNFIDQIVENHDARVMLNQDGEILLLWTFLDRSTIVITTNGSTLREVISRISQLNTLSLPPGQ